MFLSSRGWDGWMASLTRWMWVWVQTPGVGDGQGGLACCDSWGCKESDMTERLNWTGLFYVSSNCCFLTCIQVSQEIGKVIWYSHLFKKFPQFVVIHTVKGFGIFNKAEIDAFWNSLAFSMIQRMLAIWFLFSFSFCLSEKLFFCPWILNDNLEG